MAISAVDKVKINKYLREHSIEDIYYNEMCDILGKRGKMNDLEFLEYFVDSVVNELRKDEKISTKHVSKIIYVVGSFLTRVNQSNTEVPDIILDKIRNFQNFYDEYINRVGCKLDSDIVENSIKDLIEYVEEVYLCPTQSESLVDYINKLEELAQLIKQLQKELENLTSLYESVQKTNVQQSETIDTLHQEKFSLDRQNRAKEKEIKNLNNTIESLNLKIQELEASLSETQEERNTLVPYREQFDILTAEVARLQAIIEEQNRLKTNAINLEIKHSQLEALIYQKILFERSSIDEILKYTRAKGITSDRNEIISLLRRMKSKINIDDSHFISGPTYKVESPRVLESGRFVINIPTSCKHYDILLVSDFHIKNIDDNILAGFHMINNYCIQRGVKLILNLGDFYHGLGGKVLEYENAIRNYQLIEQAITKIPKVDDVYHAILGGNHDRNIGRYGFDPIKMFAEERSDFINLGYNHSIIALQHDLNLLGQFDIHHPDTFGFPIILSDDGINLEDINSYLDNLYINQGRSRDDSYIDIFGHTHKSQFNYLSSCCYVPSLFEGNTRKGACHLRIYFDDNNQIKYMVFMPLNITDKLVKNNEIIYKKTLSK